MYFTPPFSSIFNSLASVNLFKILKIFSNNFSFGIVYFFFNFCTISFVVIGLRCRYLRTSSSLIVFGSTGAAGLDVVGMVVAGLDVVVVVVVVATDAVLEVSGAIDDFFSVLADFLFNWFVSSSVALRFKVDWYFVFGVLRKEEKT